MAVPPKMPRELMPRMTRLILGVVSNGSNSGIGDDELVESVASIVSHDLLCAVAQILRE